MKTTLRRTLRTLVILNALQLVAVLALVLAILSGRLFPPPTESVPQISAVAEPEPVRSATLAARPAAPLPAAVAPTTDPVSNPMPSRPGPAAAPSQISKVFPAVLPTAGGNALSPSVVTGPVRQTLGGPVAQTSAGGSAATGLAMRGIAVPGAPAVSNGPAASASSAAADTVPGTDSIAESGEAGAIRAPEGARTVPVAFEEMEPEIANDPVKRAEVQRIRDEFVESISGPDGTTPDEISLPDWIDAQWLADEKYRMRFGQEAWNAKQRQAAAAIGRELERSR